MFNSYLFYRIYYSGMVVWCIVVVCKYDIFYCVGEGGGWWSGCAATSANIMRIDSMLAIFLHPLVICHDSLITFHNFSVNGRLINISHPFSELFQAVSRG